MREKSHTIPTKLIAPCGMNCRLCRAYIRDKNRCPGCRVDDNTKPQYCIACKLKNCENLAAINARYCYACDDFPCARLKRLDKRYRTRYGMSMLENLAMIKTGGIRQFIRNEKDKWRCPDCGDMICVHKPQCLSCGYQWQ